jgi:Prenyltransferase and squalene oxidase repeat
VSWQLASLAIVLASLAGAFWWYERSEPPAKLIAVVATLAALAALGRDAFAAIPDVKPITAIVLVGGLAFGARAGFAIGAVSGLASNVLLGQGPWTPWQMLGWGLVGLLGAAMARLPGRVRGSRLALALACALAAEMFNLVVDLYTWTGTGEHSLAAFGVVLGTAIVFDLTHVGASFAFGLAFGPALLRILTRVRDRLQVSWQPAATPPRPPLLATASSGPPAALLALALCVPVIALGLAACANATKPAGKPAHDPPGAATARAAVSRELAYLVGAQNADGGFGAAPGQHSSELYSAWAAIGLAAAGRDPAKLASSAGHTVLDALRGELPSLSGAGDIERTILALRACGAPVRAVPGLPAGSGDLIAQLLRFRAAGGSFGHLSNLTAFAILALRAAGYGARAPVVTAAASWLARQQDGDGGFGFGPRGSGSDIDDTGSALQALAIAAPRHAAVSARALAFLRRMQNPDGGYPQEAGGESNAQSTAWAVQGLIAAGQDPAKVRRRGSISPTAFLLSLVQPDGSVRYSRTGQQTPVWVTAQTIAALAGKPLPVAPPAR